jgi:hypothetical protein
MIIFERAIIVLDYSSIVSEPQRTILDEAIVDFEISSDGNV